MASRILLTMFSALFLLLPFKAAAQDWVAEHTGEFSYSPNRNGHPNFFYGMEIARKMHAYFRFSCRSPL